MIITNLWSGELFFRQGAKKYAWYNNNIITEWFVCCLPVKSDVIMCHAINVSQSDFTGNYLHVAIQGKTQWKQNSTLAGMSAKSDFIHKIIEAISANPTWQLVGFLCSNNRGTKNVEIKWYYHQAQSTAQWHLFKLEYFSMLVKMLLK